MKKFISHFYFSANRKSLVFDDLEIFNINNSKGVGVQQITCTGK